MLEEGGEGEGREGEGEGMQQLQCKAARWCVACVCVCRHGGIHSNHSCFKDTTVKAVKAGGNGVCIVYIYTGIGRGKMNKR